MTVLYCLSHINKSLQWQWFAEELHRRGIRQIYVVIDSGNGIGNYFYQDLLNIGVEAHLFSHNNRFSHVRNILRVRSLIIKNKVDVVHTSLPFGNLVGQTAAWLAGKKNRITTCENASWAHDFGHKKQEWIDRYTYKKAKKVIAVADSAEEYLKEHFQLPDHQLLSIYHGLKESEYESISTDRVEKLKKQFHVKDEDLIVGVIARYEFWKGHEFINKAAAILKEKNQHQNIRFLIFGSKGSYFETAMQQIRDLDVGDVVQYMGFCDDPVALFRVFNIHLHVPVNKYVENCGINIIEGMISERPQILTKSGYAWQSAKHMENAYVVDYENAEQIANAVLFLKEQKETALRLASAAKAEALHVYGLKVKADRHLELYNELLK